MNKSAVVFALSCTVVAGTLLWLARDRSAETAGVGTTEPRTISPSAVRESGQENKPESPKPARPRIQDWISAGSKPAPSTVDEDREAAQETAAMEGDADVDSPLPSVVRDSDETTHTKAIEHDSVLGQSGRIVCEFSVGSNAMPRNGRSPASDGAVWQGGAITYDRINFAEGTAQMLGSVGATGSQEGHADARVIARGPRVDFLVSLPSGGMVFTTIFGESSENGRYVAVMSRHEGLRAPGTGTYGAQFIGSCR
ncbi:MAG: hypothetical protein ACJ8MH_07065 [Povalibacter sp.]